MSDDKILAAHAHDAYARQQQGEDDVTREMKHQTEVLAEGFRILSQRLAEIEMTLRGKQGD